MFGNLGQRVRHPGRVVAGVVVGALIVGGVTYAAIPNTITAQITACYPTSGVNKGVLRVIDAQAGVKCPVGQVAISWQQRGTRYRGAWKSTVGYSANDIVSSGGSSYVALVANTNVAVSNTTRWAVFAARGATGATGATGAKGAAAPAPANVIWVAASGGNFTSVRLAMNSISGVGQYVINVAPGTYIETAPIIMKNNVDLVGSGQGRTTITCACAQGLNPGLHSTVYAGGDINGGIRDLTLVNTGGLSSVSVALEVDQVTAKFSIVDTTLIATNGAVPLSQAMGMWIRLGSNHLAIDRVTTHVSGAPTNYGIFTQGDEVMIRNSFIEALGAGNSVWNDGSGIRMVDSIVNGPTRLMIGRCFDVFDINYDIFSCG